MAFDVFLRRELGVSSDSEGLCILLCLLVLYLDLLVAFAFRRSVLNGSHQVSQHAHLGVLGAGRVKVCCGT